MHALICSTRGNKAIHEIELGIFAFKLFERSEISVSIRSGLVIVQCALSILPPIVWNAIILFDIEFWYQRYWRLRPKFRTRHWNLFSKRFRSMITCHVLCLIFFYSLVLLLRMIVNEKIFQRSYKILCICDFLNIYCSLRDSPLSCRNIKDLLNWYSFKSGFKKLIWKYILAL